MKKIVFMILILIMIYGCGKIDNQSNQNFQDDLTYHKDKFGICYAVKKNYYQGIYSFTTVPCEKIILNK